MQRPRFAKEKHDLIALQRYPSDFQLGLEPLSRKHPLKWGDDGTVVERKILSSVHTQR